MRLTKEKNLSYLTFEMFLTCIEQIAELKYPLTFAINKNVCSLHRNSGRYRHR